MQPARQILLCNVRLQPRGWRSHPAQGSSGSGSQSCSGDLMFQGFRGQAIWIFFLPNLLNCLREGEELYMRWFSMGCNMTFAFGPFSPLNHPRPSGSESRPSQRKTILVTSKSKNYKIKCVANIPERFQTPGVVVGGIAPFTVFAGFCAGDTFCHPPFVTPWTLSQAYISEAVRVDTRAA